MTTLYERRLVVRNSLTDLEGDIIELEKKGWQIDPTVPEQNSGTILGALRKMREGSVKVGIPVPMRRAISQPAA